MVWITEIKKPDPLTGKIKSWCGPRIEANFWEDAVIKADKIKGCEVIGILVAEIDYVNLEEVWSN